MKTNRKYDPEDIESLLLHKQFYELYPEEKEFVLQFIEGPDEYESMRKTLFEVRNASKNGEWLDPDPQLKADLMKEFVVEKKSGFRIWLNSLFVFPEIKWYRQPAFRLAMVTCVLVIGLVFVFRKSDRVEPQIAQVNPDLNQKEVAPVMADTIDNLNNTTNELFAENKNQAFPEAPMTITETMETLDQIEAPIKSVPKDENLVEESAPAVTDDLSSSDNEMSEKDNVGTIKEEQVTTLSMNEDIKAIENITLSSIELSSKKLVGITQQSIASTSVAMSKQKDILNLLYTSN